MNILILDWGSYTQADITEELRKRYVNLKTVNYCFGNKNEDSFFEKHFQNYIQEADYDAVFTVNYFPLVAKICKKMEVKYLSWSYDNPLNVVNIEETLGYETNYVFLFDSAQVRGFHNQGFPTVYHLPLAVNPSRLNGIKLNTEEQRKYAADISFVGGLYQNTFQQVIAPLSEYTKGILEGIAEAQRQVYGYYFVDELLHEKRIEAINKEYDNYFREEKRVDNIFQIAKEQLSYSIATHITRKERLLLLSLLAGKNKLKLYSRESYAFSSNVENMGSVGYFTDMPKVFKASKINLNITLKILQAGIPLRALDIMGCKGVLFSNYQQELADQFIPDQDYIQYESMEDAVEKATFYLANDELRKRIGQSGYEKTCTHFSYGVQLNKMFQIAELL